MQQPCILRSEISIPKIVEDRVSLSGVQTWIKLAEKSLFFVFVDYYIDRRISERGNGLWLIFVETLFSE